MDQLLTLLRDEPAATFGFAGTVTGAVIGALVTLLATWGQSKRELRSRLWEKVLDRRIEAHERVIMFAKTMRTMVTLGYEEAPGELARAPAALMSYDGFNEWYLQFYEASNLGSTWLSTELTRELNLLQDYLVNLDLFLRRIKPDASPHVGVILRQDFIDFSTSIEKLAFQFFSQDLAKLRLNDLRKWHKYPRKETERRLDRTVLLSRKDELEMFTTDDVAGLDDQGHMIRGTDRGEAT